MLNDKILKNIKFKKRTKKTIRVNLSNLQSKSLDWDTTWKKIRQKLQSSILNRFNDEIFKKIHEIRVTPHKENWKKKDSPISKQHSIEGYIF